ncbi:hypothetical protein E2C01_008109 [Portunus trituberculatus]|uniref:Uncharacterized protein n=1 Tax=Portunus trituberculatus TaxID=210409 RepID=A0A5B7CZX5_PORTR|nr:hypothetical protein [Portunus trituberculatus]
MHTHIPGAIRLLVPPLSSSRIAPHHHCFNSSSYHDTFITATLYMLEVSVTSFQSSSECVANSVLREALLRPANVHSEAECIAVYHQGRLGWDMQMSRQRFESSVVPHPPFTLPPHSLPTNYRIYISFLCV